MTENEIGKVVMDCAVHLLNFGEELMKDGIFRILNGHVE